MLALKADGICKAYGKGAARREILRGFSLDLPRGEFTALMGPSGSGKSTFLNIASGLLLPDAGRVEIGGECITSLDDGAAARFRRRRIGIVFQDFNLLETVTVAENIVLPARLDRVAIDRGRLGELVGKLGLAGLEDRLPCALSGGERQRVAFARALYSRPEVVLADEPTGNLDERSSRAVCEMLEELNGSEKSAILLVTHDPVVASSASRVCFLADGAIASSIPAKEGPGAISKAYLENFR